METINATVTASGRATVTAGPDTVQVGREGSEVESARQAVLAAARDLVKERGAAHQLVIDDLGTRHVLVLHTDGSLVRAAPVVESTAPVRELRQPPATAPVAASAPAEPAPAREYSLPPTPTAAAAAAGAGAGAEQPQSRRDARATRQSFLRVEQVEQPATRGLRGAAALVGWRLPPSEAERAERLDRRTVSQHWPGPRTVAVVNGKGGAHKTGTVVNLGAVFAREGGAGVVAWDNNQTRGTLGWRTEQGPHDATLLDLLAGARELLGARATVADLARFVHHQTADRFDVLRSKPAVLASEQRIAAGDVDTIHEVLTKYYRMVLIDSGNDETDPMWRQMIAHTDQLVVATTTREDNREAGALLLEALSDVDERCAALADNAVVVVSQAEQNASAALVRQTVEQFRPFVREVVTIPYDPALVTGHIQFDAQKPATQRAWLRAAAAVGRGL
ncbi:AAA family ATPase [Pseudoclavibacter helvolus]|uniref:AAA family ATPase n=1 Tax=Pseudoclavibacter helvolus TaxID=255205 RepID=UPI0024AE856B|nr:AAA family ATPase [Pseudoclavibacter helvolus]